MGQEWRWTCGRSGTISGSHSLCHVCVSLQQERALRAVLLCDKAMLEHYILVVPIVPHTGDALQAVDHQTCTMRRCADKHALGGQCNHVGYVNRWHNLMNLDDGLLQNGAASEPHLLTR